MSEWIEVGRSLPGDGQTVLIFSAPHIQIADYRPLSTNYRWDCDTFGYSANEVTHWMPLPDPPKGGSMTLQHQFNRAIDNVRFYGKQEHSYATKRAAAEHEAARLARDLKIQEPSK